MPSQGSVSCNQLIFWVIDSCAMHFLRRQDMVTKQSELLGCYAAWHLLCRVGGLSCLQHCCEVSALLLHCLCVALATGLWEQSTAAVHGWLLGTFKAAVPEQRFLLVDPFWSMIKSVHRCLATN